MSLALEAPPRPGGAGTKLDEALEHFRRSTSPSGDALPWQVARMLERVHADFCDPTLTVASLRRRCRIGDHNASCRFKQQVGVSVQEYIASLRLDAAASLLGTGSFRAWEVGHAIGYRNPQTFYRRFAARFGCTPGEFRRRSAGPGTPCGLTAAERATLAAAMERILPSDGGPGAAEAGAVGYADWLIAQPAFASQLRCLTSGLALLDSLAGSLAESPFASCAPAERDAVLGEVQRVPHPTIRRFFDLLVRITLGGFLCPPAYGGNRDEVGWGVIGFSAVELPGSGA